MNYKLNIYRPKTSIWYNAEAIRWIKKEKLPLHSSCTQAKVNLGLSLSDTILTGFTKIEPKPEPTLILVEPE